MTPTIDRTDWSGDGDFAVALLECLGRVEEIAVIKIQDAPTSRAEAGFNFIGNDLFVGFRVERRMTVKKLLGVLPVPAVAHVRSLTLEGLATRLEGVEGIGAPGYQDAEMLQYLRAERVAAPYQARGPKIVEVVRVFEAKPL
ncbi:MAG: hypothetical protein ACM3NQ_06245 [Bacteroidales bacterium]